MYISKPTRDKSKQIMHYKCKLFDRNTRYSRREHLLSIKLLIVFLTFFASTIPLTTIPFEEAYKNEKSRRSKESFKDHSPSCLLHEPRGIFRKYLDKIRNLISEENVIDLRESADQVSRAAITYID